jgi:large subunit ribosomal protein L17
MLANLVCSLIKEHRVVTTLAKARAVRPVAEKLMTLAKAGSLHGRRLVSARLRQDEEAVRVLFRDLAPGHAKRPGGYTRIVKMLRRNGDAAEMALIEWVEGAAAAAIATGGGSAEGTAAGPKTEGQAPVS